MKRVVPIVLVLLMLASLFAGISMVELNDDVEMDTGGRADYEIKLHDVIEPRETFVDMGGHTRNGIDVGDSVNFRPVIVNAGDNNQTEVNVRVQVETSDGLVEIINTEDDIICDNTQSCVTTSLASGQFLGGGTYLVQNADGTVLTWTPDTPGEYTVTITVIAIDSAHDSNLLNNDMTFNVVVAHYHDIEFDMCWTDSNGDCASDAPVTGVGPHSFAVMTNISGSESWQAREVTIELTFSGDWDEATTQFESTPIPVGGVITIVLGTPQSVPIWHNISNPEATDQTNSNPCANKDNPCLASRNIADFGVPYMFSGLISGDAGAPGGTEHFRISGGLLSFKSYEPIQETFSDPANPNSSGETFDYMIEVDNDNDDRSGNNHAVLDGSFGVFHDIAVTTLVAGDLSATEGLINVGITKLYSQVMHDGSDMQNSYDWSVTFAWSDESGMENSMTANECLYGEDPYSHSFLGLAAGESPAGLACVDVDFQPGRYTVTATVNFIDYNSNGWEDMNSGNDMIGSSFESVNDRPTVYLSLGADIVQPVIIGDSISFIARGEDTETSPEMLEYEWSRMTQMGLESMEDCRVTRELCSIPNTDHTWIGERTVTVTVTDQHGASQTDTISVRIWNHYVTSATLTGISVDYSLVFGPVVNFSMDLTDSGAITSAVLGDNEGDYDSVAAFTAVSTTLFSPVDLGAESLAVTFSGDSTTPYGLWLDQGAGWSMLSTTTAQSGDSDVVMTFSHAGGTTGNLPGGTYAVFETANMGGVAPATGISGLTATLKPDAQIELSWGLSDEGLSNVDDHIYIYHCAGAGCDPLAGTAMPAMAIDSTGTILNGQDGEVKSIMVRVENGQIDSNGDSLFGTPVGSLEVTADGSVNPAPSDISLSATDASESVAFTWTAATTEDTASWRLCWGGYQFEVEGFDGLECSDTSDDTGSLTLTKSELCGGPCTGLLYFAVAGVDTTGNVADERAQLTMDMQEEIVNPGVTEWEGDDDPDDGATNTAMIAIVVLVVLAVIGGAFILTRGGGGDGEDKEWDY